MNEILEREFVLLCRKLSLTSALRMIEFDVPEELGDWNIFLSTRAYQDLRKARREDQNRYKIILKKIRSVLLIFVLISANHDHWRMQTPFKRSFLGRQPEAVVQDVLQGSHIRGEDDRRYAACGKSLGVCSNVSDPPKRMFCSIKLIVSPTGRYALAAFIFGATNIFS